MEAKDRVRSMLADGFERNLFEAALQNLNDANNPLRFNNFAYAARELARHVLHRLGPDSQILKCSWYRNETRKENVVSRRERAYFAVQGGLADTFVDGILKLSTNEIHTALIHAITELNRFTHIEPKTFDIPETAINSLVDETVEAVANLFDTIEDCRSRIIERLSEHIDSEVVAQTMSDTIQAIDELATHHFIDEVYVDEIQITSIGHETVRFDVSGTIGCILQWGSNSDVRKGDGAELSQSFPFSCKMFSPVAMPSAIQTESNSLEIDTSAWRKKMQDEAPDFDDDY